MNIAQTNSDTDNQTVYININPILLAENIDNGTLTHQFNGKGNTVTTIPASDESTYLSYSSDKTGDNAITPPLVSPKAIALALSYKQSPVPIIVIARLRCISGKGSLKTNST